LTAEGEVYCWGLGGFGQLGHGSVVDVSLVPVRVASDEHFVDITCGSYHACGATAGGTAYCWGDENSGKLGNGAEWDGYAEPQPTPLPVVGGHSFVSISAAYNHTCAVTAEGKAYCWGSNRYGQLGNGEGSGVYTSPVAAVSERSFKIVRAGSHDFTCGVTLDDTLLCWGHNDLSQLGRGTDTKEELIPESPVGLSTAIAVDGAWAHTCAIATDGSAYCWGQCARCGKLGDGQFASSMVPVPVAGGLTFKSIDTGGDTSCGVTVDDRGYCWGWNFMLGDQTECWGVPTRVPGQRSWSWP
jgi:alpha-tubulin suppressor-like RCC1 family protein